MHLYEEEWVLFRSFGDEASARGMELWLTNEQVPVRREGRLVFVLRTFEHRAEWVVDHLPPTDEDLNKLAVGGN